MISSWFGIYGYLALFVITGLGFISILVPIIMAKEMAANNMAANNMAANNMAANNMVAVEMAAEEMEEMVVEMKKMAVEMKIIEMRYTTRNKQKLAEAASALKVLKRNEPRRDKDGEQSQKKGKYNLNN